MKNNVMKRILGYGFKYPFLFIFSILLAFLFVFAKVGAAFFATRFFSAAFIEKNLQGSNIIYILMLVGLVFAWVLSHYLIFVSSTSLAMNVIHDIRKSLYDKILLLPMDYFKKSKLGDIISRLINDVQVIEIFFMNVMVELLIQPLTLISVVFILFFINFKLSLYFFSITPIIAILLAGIGNLVQKLSHTVQKNISNITSVIQESIYGIEIIKGFSIEDNMKDKFFYVNKNYLSSTKKEIRIRFLGTPTSEFLGALGIIIILFFGSLIVKNGLATPAEIISFITLCLLLAEPLSKSTDVFMVLRKLVPAGKRIFEIIDYEIKNENNLIKISEIKGEIDFEKVYFGYEGDSYILKDINFNIKEGETVAIVGHSGAGKSTIVSLILGFYFPTKGKILIDKSDIRTIDTNFLRKKVSIVTQENILFSGTIEENIKLSKPDATMEEVIEAAKIANAHNFISKLEKGYQTEIGDRGVKLSGGERQRIALARAILRKPKILILDEATSSLDAESETLIKDAMETILGKQTTIIIAHKLSTIMKADKIIVLENGEIVEIGTHSELVSQKGIYNRLFNIQISID
ncbi:MAG: ABC transporter ATP-binding protein/permease [Brevinematales bacterium]|nr:ABC transporter ATP-binding protein/permease [Brevinematales bacterium]